MKNIMRLIAQPWIWLALSVLMLCAFLTERGRVSSLEKEKETLSVDLAHAELGRTLTTDIIRDSGPASTAPVVQVKARTYKEQLADKALLRDLGLRAAQVETQQVSGTVVHDTVRLQPDGSSWAYHDRWAQFRLRMEPQDTTLAYSVRDSVTTVVYREYRHRFLWWRWGTKGYRVRIVNFNPHATLLYEQYVRVEK